MKLLQDLADGIIVYVIIFATWGVIWVVVKILGLFLRFVIGDY